MSGPISTQSENSPDSLRPWELVEEIVELRAENAELREKIELLEKPKAERIWFLVDPKSKETKP